MPKNQSISTQQFVDIEEIHDGAVILKGGGLRRLLIVSGVNLELKPEEEQNIVVSSFQNFLNTLDFSMQFVIHSRRMNTDLYLEMLKDRQSQETNELLKNQIAEYIEFVRSFVAENAVMEKTFFAVVPYDPIIIPKAGQSLIANLKFWEKTRPQQKEDEGIERQIIQLNQRTEVVIAGLSQIGLRAVPLNDEELIELFYNLYNPEAVEKRELKIAKE